ncbi:hypothetical protein [Limnohabitans sp. TS-CS-82]|uniref:hypothetical protein n=1 Tax=Limnohabitans sp. TS-CS-82 TaxID=2094193 RepID=UPI001374B415|nr:hypothetical protein [Limnohabitans sp. TS-CS-82]
MIDLIIKMERAKNFSDAARWLRKDLLGHTPQIKKIKVHDNFIPEHGSKKDCSDRDDILRVLARCVDVPLFHPYVVKKGILPVGARFEPILKNLVLPIHDKEYIVISHAAKSVQYQQEVGSHASRGSGAITDAFRLEVLMRVMTPREAKDFRIDDLQRHRFVRMQVTKANSLPPDLMHPVWLERVNGGALTLSSLKPATVTRPRSALELFFEANPETGELSPISLSFATWKVKALDAGLLTGKTDSARDMSARRLLATIKSSKWIEVHQGIYKPTDEGIAELLG